MVQLPDEARGVAAAVLMFAFISWIAGCLLIWLVWTHHERTSYVALIAYFTFIATTTSISQQIHLYLRWIDVMVTQYDHTKENFGNAELVVSSSTTGIDLVLFYIPNVVGKLVSIIFPVTSIALLQLEAVQGSFMGFLILADLPRIYDRWLLIRFSIGFCILALFNLTNILCQISWNDNISRDVEADGPDMSAERARHDSALFLPGVSSSLLAFIIFGTTTPFRTHMREVFIDRWRRRRTQPSPMPSPSSPQTGYDVRVYGPNGPNPTTYAVRNEEGDIELQHTKPSNSLSTTYTESDSGRADKGKADTVPRFQRGLTTRECGIRCADSGVRPRPVALFLAAKESWTNPVESQTTASVMSNPYSPTPQYVQDSWIPPHPLLLRQHLVRDRVHHLGVEDVGSTQLPREGVPPPHDRSRPRQVLLDDAIAVPRQDLEIGRGRRAPFDDGPSDLRAGGPEDPQRLDGVRQVPTSTGSSASRRNSSNFSKAGSYCPVSSPVL
ncbi:hypothetical protein DL771_008700 [Monosporascus sp. 5C6A]|nr:hypothetical protein DL771_008700 [Monosporascus sp. 5C6A]